MFYWHDTIPAFQSKAALMSHPYLPRVLGLTASIVTKKCDRVKFAKLKEELEEKTDCKVVTTENLANLLR